jgi:hypothetical protein
MGRRFDHGKIPKKISEKAHTDSKFPGSKRT